MGYKILFVLNALVVVVLGAALMFVPETVLAQFRTQMRVPELVFARCLGAALLTLGLMFWFAKDTLESNLQKNIGIAGLVGSILAIVVTVIGITGSVIILNGWIAIVVEVVFGLAYAFMLFLKPKMKE